MARSSTPSPENPVEPTPAEASAASEVAVDLALVNQRLQADTVSTRFALYAAAGGVIPVPFLDLAAITALQVRMIEVLCKIYDRPFNEQTAKVVISSTVSTLGVYPIASRYLASGLKAIPGIGQLLGAAAGPAIAGGLTYALGRMFSRHFETGGSLVNINLGGAKELFNEYYEKGKGIVGSAARTIKKPFDVPASVNV